MSTRIHVAGHQAPAPAVITAATAQLRKLAQDLGIDGQGGDPPLGMERMPEPARVLSPARASRVTFVLQAEQLSPEDTKPIATEIQGVKQDYTDHEESWKVYSNSYSLMREGADYQLATGAGHRLVRRRVLQGTAVVLRQADLPDDERIALSLDLTELQALISRELADVQAAREQSGADTQALDLQLAELSAEEHLVDVMRRMAVKEQVTQAEMDAAAATYEQYVTQDEAELRSAPR